MGDGRRAAALRWTDREQLVALYVVHLVVLGLYVFDVLPQRFHTSAFAFHTGGDERFYFEQADNLLAWEFEPNKYPLGYPMLLVPFLLVFGRESAGALVEPVAFTWAVLLFPAGQFLLHRLASTLTGSRRLAFAVVLVWTLVPLAIYAVLWAAADAVAAETWSVSPLWAQMLSDGPATLLTLVAMWVFVRGWEAGSARWASALGALAGFLTMVRFTAVITLVALVVALLVARRTRQAALMVATAVLVALPQGVYNAHIFGSPFRTGYSTLDEIPEHGLFDVRYLLDALQGGAGRVGPGFWVLTVAALALGAVVLWRGLVVVARCSGPAAWAIGTSVVLYLAVYGTYWYSWAGGLTRFLMPVFPMMAILAVASASDAGRILRRRAVARPERG